MFAHEKLHVYGKALAFAASATACSAGWDKGHAVVDPLGRASDSVILNLADGARFQAGASKVRALDYSMGSTLGWAACLDVARIKNLLEKPQTDQEKQRLSEITSMLIGLNEALTSIILNLAEGNGRYSEQDHWITPRAAPTLCIHGTKDDYVGYEKATWMVDRLKAAAVPAELLPFEGAGHGLKGTDAESADRAMLAFFEKYLKPGSR